MSREDQYSVTVSVAGKDYGVFDKLSGGESDSDDSKYRPGGMSPQISLGGSKEVGNLTVSRLYDHDRDHNKYPELEAQVGKGKAVVTKQPLDVDGHAFGKPIVYTGLLKTLTPPDHDSESNDAALVELEISTNGTVG